MIGPAVGPVLGGYITDNYSWPWIFYINLPVGIIGILMTVRNVHEPDDVRAANRARAEVARKNLDIAGIVLMVVGDRRAAVPVRGRPAGRLVRLDRDPDRGVRRAWSRSSAFVDPRAHRDRAGRQPPPVQGSDVRVGDASSRS